MRLSNKVRGPIMMLIYMLCERLGPGKNDLVELGIRSALALPYNKQAAGFNGSSFGIQHLAARWM